MPQAINIPIYELAENIEKTANDKSQILIVYCLKGIRSKEAIKILKSKGYEKIYRVNEELEF